MSRPTIPIPVIAVVAQVLEGYLTHSQINALMERVGLPGPVPEANKLTKLRIWLKRANEDDGEKYDVLRILGKVLEEYMEVNIPGFEVNPYMEKGRGSINDVLREHGLDYAKGGYIVQVGIAAVTNNLRDIIQARDLSALHTEYERILKNVESDPAAAITSSCALLESLFQSYIEQNKLEMPSDKSIKPLWNVVRKHLQLDPAATKDEDLRKILSGLSSVVDGIAGLRTHRGSAHGHTKQEYKIEAQHSRLTAHAAVALATFILESWPQP